LPAGAVMRGGGCDGRSSLSRFTRREHGQPELIAAVERGEEHADYENVVQYVLKLKAKRQCAINS
jgi:hypothetical protein